MLLSANMIRIHDVFGMKETFDVFAKAGVEGFDFDNDVEEYRSDQHDEHFYHLNHTAMAGGKAEKSTC